jgi:acyl-CoA dehydrogenase
MHVGAAQTINLFGNDDQKERWLNAKNGGLLGTYSTSERASGGHWWYNFSEAGRDGDGYVVNAEKSFTTSSGQADFYLVQTRTPGAKDQADIVFFIVDGKASGIESSPWDALGVRANHSGPIRYKGVKVPKRDRLGTEGQGKEIIYDGVSPVYLIGLRRGLGGCGARRVERGYRPYHRLCSSGQEQKPVGLSGHSSGTRRRESVGGNIAALAQ